MPSSPLGTARIRSLRDVVREAFISGLAVVVPVVVTVAVFAVLFNTIYGYLALFSEVLPIFSARVTVVPGVVSLRGELLVQLLVPIVVLGAVFWVGLVVNSSRYGERAIDYFDYVVAQIPGVGSIYESFRQMSDVILESDAQSFREVKLVEFPHEGAYTLGFVTTETPDALAEPTPHDKMMTLFLPLAPNPVMGGHLVHLPKSRVMDVDLTVEEGIQTIVTSGVAIADSDLDSGLSPEQLRTLGQRQRGRGHQRPAPGERTSQGQRDAERDAQYDAAVDPEFASRPETLASRERDPVDDVDRARPAREADRDPDAREETDGRPAAETRREVDTDDVTGDAAGGQPDVEEDRENETENRGPSERDV